MLIDWTRIDELREEIGAEDLSEVVDLFIVEVSGLVQSLDTGATPDQLERDYHAIKSSALNLGFAALAQRCLQGERAATQGSGALPTAPELQKLFDQSCAELRRGMTNSAA